MSQIAPTRHLLVIWNGTRHTMRALICFALLAVAAAKPQTSQVISSSQLPLNYQTVNTVAQPIQYQTVQTLQSPYQTVQTLQSPYQTVQTLQSPYQTVRTIPLNQQQLIQSLPVNTISGLSYQPAQVRVGQQVRPLRTQTIVQQPLVKTVVQQQPIRTVVQQQPIRTVVQQQPIRTVVQQQPIETTVVQQPIQTTLVQQQQPIQTVVQQTAAPLRVQTTVAPQLQVQQVVAPKVRVQPAYNSIYQNQRYAAGQYGYQGIDPVAPQGLAILRQVQDVQDDGSYAYAYETENGIKVQEEGRALNQGANGLSNVVQGSYSYISPDGTPITVNYVADENGFRAEGEHIPKPSEEILRSVEYLRSLPPRPEDAAGQYVPDANGY